MPRPTRNERRRGRARQPLAGTGVAAIVIGLLMLLVIPSIMRGPMVLAFGQALRPVGWLALAVGAVLLALHYAARRAGATPTVELTSTARTFNPAPSKVSPSATARQEPMLSPEPARQAQSRFASEPALRRGQQQWGPAVLAAIEWRRFEALCEAFYAQAGLATRSQSHGADGGVDIWLRSRHMDAPRIVQCKHWQGKVGVKEMREFRGVMASHQLQNGTYVTSSTFTAEAAAFAKANGIQTQDGAALLKLIGQRTPEQQAALLAVAYEGEYWRPTCASCGTKMVERTSSKDAREFWGCANFPRCRGRSMPKAGATVASPRAA